MKIGIAVGDVRGPASLAEVVGQVRAAADLGFSTAWSAQALGWDALTLLAVAGGRVPGIALGTAVVPVPQRHPLVLASHALTVQAAVGNRLTLGIGAGIGLMVQGMFGLPGDRPARRMREYLTVLGPLLRGEGVHHRGETLTASGAVDVPSAQPPSVLLAALGPAMLRVAGELADGAVTWMTGPRTLGDHVVPTLAKAAAGRPAPRVVAGLPVCVTHDEAAVRERIAERFGLAGQVPEYRAVLDREGVAGPQDVAVVGDEAAVARHLDRLADAGVTEFFASPFGDAEEQDRTVRFLAARMILVVALP
jgi:F420-dependent oxidoreductase-like protein